MEIAKATGKPQEPCWFVNARFPPELLAKLPADALCHASGNSQASRIVFGGVDALARRQLLHSDAGFSLRNLQCALGVKRFDIGVDNRQNLYSSIECIFNKQ